VNASGTVERFSAWFAGIPAWSGTLFFWSLGWNESIVARDAESRSEAREKCIGKPPDIA